LRTDFIRQQYVRVPRLDYQSPSTIKENSSIAVNNMPKGASTTELKAKYALAEKQRYHKAKEVAEEKDDQEEERRSKGRLALRFYDVLI
jgi:hypothetical protein